MRTYYLIKVQQTTNTGQVSIWEHSTCYLPNVHLQILKHRNPTTIYNLLSESEITRQEYEAKRT